MGVWTPESAKKHVVRLAKKHAKEDFERDAAAAARLTDDEVADLASEGFWNVVFPKLETQCVDPEVQVDGMSIERHYKMALLEAYAEFRRSYVR